MNYLQFMKFYNSYAEIKFTSYSACPKISEIPGPYKEIKFVRIKTHGYICLGTTKKRMDEQIKFVNKKQKQVDFKLTKEFYTQKAKQIIQI